MRSVFPRDIYMSSTFSLPVQRPLLRKNNTVSSLTRKDLPGLAETEMKRQGKTQHLSGLRHLASLHSRNPFDLPPTFGESLQHLGFPKRRENLRSSDLLSPSIALHQDLLGTTLSHSSRLLQSCKVMTVQVSTGNALRWSGSETDSPPLIERTTKEIFKEISKSITSIFQGGVDVLQARSVRVHFLLFEENL